jgi:hypothetical protein
LCDFVDWYSIARPASFERKAMIAFAGTVVLKLNGLAMKARSDADATMTMAIVDVAR